MKQLKRNINLKALGRTKWDKNYWNVQEILKYWYFGEKIFPLAFNDRKMNWMGKMEQFINWSHQYVIVKFFEKAWNLSLQQLRPLAIELRFSKLISTIYLLIKISVSNLLHYHSRDIATYPQREIRYISYKK